MECVGVRASVCVCVRVCVFCVCFLCVFFVCVFCVCGVCVCWRTRAGICLLVKNELEANYVLSDNSRVAIMDTGAEVDNNLDDDSKNEGKGQTNWTFGANPIKKVPPAYLEQKEEEHFSDGKENK